MIPVLECFGISLQPNPYNIVIPDVTYKVADIIADNLLKQQEDHWRQVGWLLKWLFSCSGSSCVDLDYETMAEFQPLSWDTDDIAFAREIVEEADGIMSDVLAGLTWINRQPNVLAALQNNIRRIYKAIERQKGKKGKPHVQLKWPTQLHQSHPLESETAEHQDCP